jgi:hypothetical protein
MVDVLLGTGLQYLTLGFEEKETTKKTFFSLFGGPFVALLPFVTFRNKILILRTRS